MRGAVGVRDGATRSASAHTREQLLATNADSGSSSLGLVRELGYTDRYTTRLY